MTSKPGPILGVGVAGVIVLVAAVLLWRGGEETQERVGQGRSSAEATAGERKNTDVERSEDSNSLGSTQTEPGPSAQIESVEELGRLVPQVAPNAIPLALYAAGESPKPAWKANVFQDLCGIDLFVEPPCASRWMFAETDRAWLERVHESYKHALQSAIAAHGDDEPLSEAAQEKLAMRIRVPYRDLIWSVARKRLQSDPDLRARFDDPRSLEELRTPLPSGQRDMQFDWLRQMVASIAPAQLINVGLNKLSDLESLSATDLPELAKLQLDLAAAYERRGDALMTVEESRQFDRRFAERLQALITAKRSVRDGN